MVEINVSLTVSVDGKSLDIYQHIDGRSDRIPALVQELVLRAADAAVRAHPPTPSPYSDDLFKVQSNGMRGVVVNKGIADKDEDDHDEHVCGPAC